MGYSYTEKKRIRKYFGKQASVLSVPALLAMQTNSYKEFLQEGADPDRRDHRDAASEYASDSGNYQTGRHQHTGQARLRLRYGARGGDCYRYRWYDA